jgi:hypothetical protein
VSACRALGLPTGHPVDDEIGGHGAFSIIDEPDLDRGTDSGF